MSGWSAMARAAIARAHQTIPEGATLAERKAAIDAAYPFGERGYWPYKAWLKARRSYLVRYGYKPRTPERKSPQQELFDRLPRDPVSGRPVVA